MHDKKLYGTATVGTKGQVVIPAAAREALGIQESDRLYVIGSKEAGWVGLLKEDKMSDIINTLTDNLASLKQLQDVVEEGYEPPLTTEK